MQVVQYQFEFAISTRPLNTVVKKGTPALMELFTRGVPDGDGDMPEPDHTVISNVEPIGMVEVSARDLQSQLLQEYPRRRIAAQNVWRDFGGNLPTSVDALEWFNPEQNYTRKYDFHLRSGGDLDSWLAGERADTLLDMADEDDDDGEGNDAREPPG